MEDRTKEFKDVIHINSSTLDVEWIQQPELMFNVICQEAEARREYERCRDLMKQTEAELKLDIREHPEKYSLAKLTEPTVIEAAEANEDIVAQRETIRNARYELDLCNGAVQAMQDRSKALQDLVRLHLAGYFATPKSPQPEPSTEHPERRGSTERMVQHAKRRSAAEPKEK